LGIAATWPFVDDAFSKRADLSSEDQAEVNADVAAEVAMNETADLSLTTTS
jgi:hypothetical protein